MTAADSPADLVIAGMVLTVDEAQPTAMALAIHLEVRATFAGRQVYCR